MHTEITQVNYSTVLEPMTPYGTCRYHAHQCPIHCRCINPCICCSQYGATQRLHSMHTIVSIGRRESTGSTNPKAHAQPMRGSFTLTRTWS